MKPAVYLLFIFIVPIAAKAVIINEIMADTLDDTNNEWIELYNNDSISIDVNNWLIGDNKSNDAIEGGLYDKEGTIIPASGFAIITDDATRVYNNFNVSEDAIRLYVDDNSIGENNLANDGETIYLYDNNGTLIDKKAYNKTTKGLSWALYNGSLNLSDPTPGFPNDGIILLETGCDYAVNFILEKALFDNSSDFSFKIRASKLSGIATNFSMRAKIEDMNGKIIREYRPFTNDSISTQRTSSELTPNLEEGKSYILDANLTTECTDSDNESNFNTEIITIKGKPPQESSSISILSILDLGNDKEAKFGQTIRARINVYKGNTNKETIDVWMQDSSGNRISKQSRAGLESKYTNYTLTIPVQINPNCDGKFDDDSYTITASGLDSEDEHEIEIAGITESLCEEMEVQQAAASGKLEYSIAQFNELAYPKKEFSTSVMLDNNEDRDMKIKLYSYVYRGSKSYSGEREENMKELTLKANSLHVIELENIIPEAEPGNYKFKVVINKDSQKTSSELTKDIVIRENSNNNANPVKNEKSPVQDDVITGNYANGIVYESSTQKAKHLVPIFLIILSVILNIVFILRR